MYDFDSISEEIIDLSFEIQKMNEYKLNTNLTLLEKMKINSLIAQKNILITSLIIKMNSPHNIFSNNSRKLKK